MAMTRDHVGRSRPGRCRRRGFTLVEAAVSVLIVGLMLTAALYALGGVGKARAVGLGQGRGMLLAQDLLNEVLRAAYTDPQSPGGWGPEAEENTATRADFDDVDDYLGWSASPPQAKDGTALAGYDGWQRSVAVSQGFAGFHDSGSAR